MNECMAGKYSINWATPPSSQHSPASYVTASYFMGTEYNIMKHTREGLPQRLAPPLSSLYNTLAISEPVLGWASATCLIREHVGLDYVEVGVMALLVKCLPCRHKDLRWITEHRLKRTRHGGVHL